MTTFSYAYGSEKEVELKAQEIYLNLKRDLETADKDVRIKVEKLLQEKYGNNWVINYLIQENRRSQAHQYQMAMMNAQRGPEMVPSNLGILGPLLGSR